MKIKNYKIILTTITENIDEVYSLFYLTGSGYQFSWIGNQNMQFMCPCMDMLLIYFLLTELPGSRRKGRVFRASTI